MIEDTIRQIEARLHASETLAPATRLELLALLTQLRAEAAHLPALPPGERFDLPGEAVEVKTMQDDVERLRHSVQDFEDSHPKVIQLVNHLANTLSGLGI